MNCTIPSKLTFLSNKSSIPWINHSYLKRVKTRNSLFISAKKGGSPRLWAKYKSYRNETLAYLRQLKSEFFQSLSTSSSPLSFWSAVKCVCSKSISILSLIQGSSVVTSPSDKANVLNQYFSSCFNNLTTPLSPSTHPPDNTFYPDYLCNPEDICNLISCIPIDTAPGPDGISSIMLHNTASSISLPLISIPLFLLVPSLQTGRTPLLCPFLNLSLLLYPLLIIIQFLFFPL